MPDTIDPNNISVLLADDHAVVRAGIRQYLEQSGLIRVVAEAIDGQQACTLISEHQPDVAVLDIQMPGMSGIEVTRWVRANQPATGILVLTAFDEEPYVRAVLRAGANGYVLKTASPAEIIAAVQDVHAGRAVIDARLAHRLLMAEQQPVVHELSEELTVREMEILTLAGKGYTNKAIAAQLHISDRTVQNHLANIFGKLQAASRTEAVMRAVALGLLPPDLGEMPTG